MVLSVFFSAAAGIQFALFLAAEVGIVARDLGIAPVEFGSAAYDFDGILRAAESTGTTEGEEQARAWPIKSTDWRALRFPGACTLQLG